MLLSPAEGVLFSAHTLINIVLFPTRKFQNNDEPSVSQNKTKIVVVEVKR